MTHDPLSLPEPSKRAKSDSALDLRYGRQGDRRLPSPSDFDQEVEFRAAVATGEVVYAECLCMRWWIAPCDVGTPCHTCGESMTAVG